MSKKIALVFPKTGFLSDSRMWPPLGLWYLGAQLEKQGHGVDFFDLNFNEMPKDGEYSQLWLSATSPQIRETKRIANETSHWKYTKTILGGAGPWANPKTHLELPFTLVVAGEADHPDTIQTLVNLADWPP